MKRIEKIWVAVLVTMMLGAFLGLMSFETQPKIVQAATDYVNAWLRSNVTASSDGTSLKVEMNPGAVATSDAATTNTVEQVFDLKRTSSGTPANNIGGSLDYTVETAAGNNEIGARIAAIATDTTSASEDFTIAFYTMAAGAAAASKATMGSTGIWALTGGATLDNTTAATELNITETTVQLTGAVDVDGGTVTINQDSGDYDFIVESNDSADALKVDAGTNTLQHGAWDSYEYVTSTAQSYSLASAGKAGIVIQTFGGAATGHLMTDLLTSPGAGGVVTWKTGGTNDIVIDTEGAETIDGAATYTLDGSYESVKMMTDGTNWFIIGGYLE